MVIWSPVGLGQTGNAAVDCAEWLHQGLGSHWCVPHSGTAGAWGRIQKYAALVR